jgi:hypothetical protein
VSNLHVELVVRALSRLNRPHPLSLSGLLWLACSDHRTSHTVRNWRTVSADSPPSDNPCNPLHLSRSVFLVILSLSLSLCTFSTLLLLRFVIHSSLVRLLSQTPLAIPLSDTRTPPCSCTYLFVFRHYLAKRTLFVLLRVRLVERYRTCLTRLCSTIVIAPFDSASSQSTKSASLFSRGIPCHLRNSTRLLIESNVVHSLSEARRQNTSNSFAIKLHFARINRFNRHKLNVGSSTS